VNFIACALPGLVRAHGDLLPAAAVRRRSPIIEAAVHLGAIGEPRFEIGFYFDRLSAVMTLIVTGVGSLIHIYSTGYMHDDKSFARYFAYLNLFLFFMLLLVLGRSLLVLFVGWEGVGLASYLLIGFWFDDLAKAAPARRPSSPTASVTPASCSACSCCTAPSARWTWTDQRRLRGGTGGRGLGQPGRHPAVRRRHRQVGADSAACVAARRHGRPHPRLALIHAATMVTAGIYLVARMSGCTCRRRTRRS
jgi:NADH-quinone oxidoreductase subunit L